MDKINWWENWEPAEEEKKVWKLPVVYDELEWYQRSEVREQYVKEQENKCFYCDGSLDENAPEHIKEKKLNLDLFPPKFLSYPIHLQHDHDTGMTEGAVHSYCNAVMWQYEGR